MAGHKGAKPKKPKSKGSGRLRLEADRERAILMWESGLTGAEIGREYGISNSTVHTVFREVFKMPMRLTQSFPYKTPPPKLDKGKKYRVGESILTYEGAIRSKAGKMHIFKSSGGWRETFTETQFWGLRVKEV